MRVALVMLVALGVPVVAAAQSHVGLPRISGRLPSIGLPLPTITPRLAPIGLPPLVDGRIAVPDGSHRRAHVPDGRHGSPKKHSRGPVVVYFAPGYFWSGHSAPFDTTDEPTYREPHAPAPRSSSNTGTLRLAIEPAALVHVYVDGFFIGTPSDHNGDLELEAGTHRVELRAEGYEVASFDVKIEAGRAITYSAPLQPLSAAPAPAPAAQAQSGDPIASPPARSTVYLIPGCYLGNVPPEEAQLPATCDTSRVTSFEP